jgi:NADPH:quinone reductase-like Zn-dependent oxidoreductase
MEFGDEDALGVVDLPEPVAGPGEVRVRVLAAAVNPTDTRIRSGVRAQAYRGMSPPYVPGMDAAGVVDQLGPGASTDLRAGDDVMAIVFPSGSHGAYSEYVVVPAEAVARIPAGSTYVEAATLPMSGLTARIGLDVLDLRPGCTLAVVGAAGIVGGYAVQLAKADGITVIADASPADELLVRELGADVVVARGPDVATRILEACPGGVDALFDAALMDDLVVPAVKDNGQITTMRQYVGQAVRGIHWHPVSVRDYGHEHAKFDHLRQQVEDGQLTLRVARTFPADRAADAHRLLAAGGLRGRIVLEF